MSKSRRMRISHENATMSRWGLSTTSAASVAADRKVAEFENGQSDRLDVADVQVIPVTQGKRVVKDRTVRTVRDESLEGNIGWMNAVAEANDILNGGVS